MQLLQNPGKEHYIGRHEKKSLEMAGIIEVKGLGPQWHTTYSIFIERKAKTGAPTPTPNNTFPYTPNTGLQALYGL